LSEAVAPRGMPSRRGLLRRAAAGAAAGVAVTVTGCGATGEGSPTNGGPSGDGSGTAAGTTGTAVAGTPPAYTDWLAAPSVVGLEDYVHLYHDVAALRAEEPHLDPDRYDAFRRRFDGRFGFLGLTYRDVDRWVKLVEPFVAVLSTTVAPDVVVDHLADYEPDGTRGAFDLYAEADGDRVVAVADGRVVAGLAPEAGEVDPRTAVTATVDAGRGAERRYVEGDADMRLLTAAVGAGTFAFGTTAVPDEEEGPPPGTVAMGSRVGVDGTTAHVRAGMVFEDAAAVDRESAREAVARRRELSDLSTTRKGRVVTVAGVRPSDGFSFGTYSA